MTPAFALTARQSTLFAPLPPQVSDKLLAGARVRRFDRGATIFLQGEKASAIYIVAEGWVKLYRIAPNGAEAVVGVFTKGRSFGEAVAFRHAAYPVAAEAVTECTLIRVEADTLLREIREVPEVAIAILSATFAHLQALVSQIEALKAQTGAQRVAEFLLDLAPCGEGKCAVILPYDKGLIAGRLGMKPESLSRAFAKLRQHGVTIRQTVAEIDDIARLQEFALSDPADAWTKDT
ncbi:MAG: Crp/Fnr family transcriptional regulator [Gemmobacter sp.]|jgi:CRP/FNR family transcriptional regulator, dissimilatory nitrate respiration regulator|nr:Crp/Fnr family transcriptional regulator [Gemmobacter sp.]